MPSCFVKSCKMNDRNKPRSVTFHRIPIYMKQKWLTALGRESNMDINYTTSICSLHFNESDYYLYGQQKRLKEGVIPSLNLSCAENNTTGNAALRTNEETNLSFETSVQTKNKNRKCAVKFCKNQDESPGISFYKIPLDNCQAWFNVLNKFLNEEIFSLNILICSQHFKQDDFIYIQCNNGINRKLKKGAVPSVALNLIEKKINYPNNFNRESPLENVTFPVILPAVYTTQTSEINKSNFTVVDIKAIETGTYTNETSESNILENTSEVYADVSVIREMHCYSNKVETENINFKSNKLTDYQAKMNATSEFELNNNLNHVLNNIEENNNSFKSNDSQKNKQQIDDIEHTEIFSTYKRAYKKQKLINKKQKEKINALKHQLNESSRRNQQLEQRVEILDDIIQNLLKKRIEKVNQTPKN